jgi:hypothetical protein
MQCESTPSACACISTKVCMQVHTIPIFMVYLVLLMHNYFLGLVQPRPGPQSPRFLTDVDRRSSLPQSAPPTSIPFAGTASRFAAMFCKGLNTAWRYVSALCEDCALAPHCLLVHVQVLAFAIKCKVHCQSAFQSHTVAVSHGTKSCVMPPYRNNPSLVHAPAVDECAHAEGG